MILNYRIKGCPNKAAFFVSSHIKPLLVTLIFATNGIGLLGTVIAIFETNNSELQ